MFGTRAILQFGLTELTLKVFCVVCGVCVFFVFVFLNREDAFPAEVRAFGGGVLSRGRTNFRS